MVITINTIIHGFINEEPPVPVPFLRYSAELCGTVILFYHRYPWISNKIMRQKARKDFKKEQDYVRIIIIAIAGGNSGVMAGGLL